MTKMEDDQNGGRPKRKRTEMEDDLESSNGRRLNWKMTKMEDDQNGGRPERKRTEMEDDLTSGGLEGEPHRLLPQSSSGHQ